MDDFATMRVLESPTVTAPDGSDVRVLLRTSRGSMAHFELAAGRTSIAVTHRTVEEIWYVVSGRGEMWRKQGQSEEVVSLEPGVCLTIPRGTHFQFRAAHDMAVSAIGVTMPPWPGDAEAIAVSGPWSPSVAPSLPRG
jgi:mannose-6-phosphate isomerase-like protein (cupin superfamily)